MAARGKLSDDARELLSMTAAIIEEEARRGLQGLGGRVTTRMCLELGGQKIYFPKNPPGRDPLIYSLFDGRNYNALARRFHLTENSIRRIIKLERARRRHTQLTLIPAKPKAA
jgi:Mor family transcriptional regulator